MGGWCLGPTKVPVWPHRCQWGSQGPVTCTCQPGALVLGGKLLPGLHKGWWVLSRVCCPTVCSQIPTTRESQPHAVLCLIGHWDPPFYGTRAPEGMLEKCGTLFLGAEPPPQGRKEDSISDGDTGTHVASEHQLGECLTEP